MTTLSALERFLLALATYVAALLAAWALGPAKITTADDAAMYLAFFPMGLWFMDDVLDWLGLPLFGLHGVYAAGVAALTAVRRAAPFWRIYAAFAGLLAVNVAGCAMMPASF